MRRRATARLVTRPRAIRSGAGRGHWRRRVRLVELADHTVMVEMVVVLVGIVDQIISAGAVGVV
jgi:hypothetical protein